jgi:hypothetical protein
VLKRGDMKSCEKPRRTADTQYKRGRRGYGGGVPTPLHRPEMGGARSLRWGTEPRPLGRQVRAGYRGIGLAQPTNVVGARSGARMRAESGVKLNWQG